MNKLIDFNKIAQESVPIKDVINLKNIVDKTYSCEPYPPDSLKSVEQSYKQQTESQSDILENTMVPVQRVDGQQVLTERSSSPVTQGFLGDLQLRNPQPYDDFYERKAFIPGMVTDTNKNKQGIENKDTVYDWVNYSGCPELILIKHTVSEEHEDGIDGCAGLIDRKRKNNDFKRKIVANLFFENVIDYGYKYTATAIFLDKNGMVQREEVKITQTGSCETIKAVNELKAYGIDCFSLSTPMKIINSCIQTVLSRKARIGCELPVLPGWSIINSKYVFASQETCAAEEIPADISQSFDVRSDISNRDIAEVFVKIFEISRNPYQFMLVNMIRILSLITTILREISVVVKTVFVVQGDIERLSLFTQVYNRDYGFNEATSINVKDKIFKMIMGMNKDCVALFNDNEDATKHMQQHGVSNMGIIHGILRDMAFNGTENNFLHPYVIVIRTTRLGEYLKPNEKIYLDLKNMELPGIEDSEVFMLLYELDKMIVSEIMGNPEKMKEYYADCYERYYDKYEFEFEETEVVYCTFMTSYCAIKHVLQDYIADMPLSEYEMSEHLCKLLSASEKSNDKASVVGEFIQILNECIVCGELEYVLNSALTGDVGISGEKEVVFYDTKHKAVLITDGAMNHIIEKMMLESSACIMRKKLDEERLLQKNDELKFSVKLYGNIEAKETVTAVYDKVVEPQSQEKLIGDFYNIIHCSDDNKEKLCVGYDKHGRGVYWSINHPSLSSEHLLILGSTGTGKSFAMNLIVKQLYEMQRKIVFVNFKQLDFKEELITHGFQPELAENCVDYYEIDKVASCGGILKSFLEEDYRKMIVFTAPCYTEDVERILSDIYMYVSNQKDLEITLIIDEVHCLANGKSSALYKIMSMGRGVGISLISALQSPGQLSTQQRRLLEQAPLKMLFRLDQEQDLDAGARIIGKKPYHIMMSHIKSLPKRSFIFNGFIEAYDGELYSGRFIQVETPFIERD